MPEPIKVKDPSQKWKIALFILFIVGIGLYLWHLDGQVQQLIGQKQVSVATSTRIGPDYIYPLVSGEIDEETSNNVWGTICNPKWSTSSIRPSTSYTNALKVKDLATYNAKFGTNYTMRDGEEDHIISLELGGSPTSTDNLWFEPYITKVLGQQLGAHEKDSVENRLHKEVCLGTKTLEEAQAIITTDWYKYFISGLQK